LQKPPDDLKGILMTDKKAPLLIAVALATIAFAVPAAALASPLTWKDKGVVLKPKEHATLGFSGKVSFEYLGAQNVLTCDANLTLTAEGGHTGTITKFELKTTSCGGNGIFEKCTVKGDKVSPLPLVVHTTTAGFELTETKVELEYAGFGCKLESSSVVYSWIIATPNKLEPIASIALYGEDSLGVHFLRGSLNAADPSTLGLG
jgi:hypothetical protein